MNVVCPCCWKGPTGCGKTRFVEHMAHVLMPNRDQEAPENIVTVACHEDLTGSDLVGRYLIQGDETVWIDGPADPGRAARHGVLSGRDRGGPQGHDRPDPPADRPPADSAHRQKG